MKLRVWCNSGANAFSKREQIIDLEDIGLTEDEWNNLSESGKEDAVRDTALDRLDWGWQELP